MAIVEKPRTEVDAVTLEVLRNGFVQICNEVTITLLKVAHSVIFNEGKDLSSAVFDRDARLIAQDMQGCPVHIAAMPYSVKAGIAQYGIEDMKPGDVFLVNDSYTGGTHLPDVTVFAPVFWEDELFGFVGNRGHHNDVGGMAPGSMPGDATEMYQEGLILPAVRIFEQGRRNRDVWNIILKNVRLPATTEGDITAQTAGVLTGVRRYHSLLERYGKDLVQAGIDEIIAYSERHMRSEIARIPDGEYHFEDYMDTDGATGRPVKIALTARKRGSDIEFDFTGSDGQVPGAVNCVYTVTVASVYIGMLMVTDPNIHPSEGAFAPVKITAPRGSCVNPNPPASTVSGLTETCNRIIDMVFGALSPGIPDRVAAGELGSCNVYTLGGQRAASGYGDTSDGGENWVAILNPKGGWGGMAYKDGWTCIQDPLSNCRIQPVEALENKFPVKVLRLELRTGTEGAGKYRGGFGLRRDIEVLHELRPVDVHRSEPHTAVRAVRGSGRRAQPDLPQAQGLGRVEARQLADVELATRGGRRGAHRDGDRRRLRRPARARPEARRRGRPGRLPLARGGRGSVRGRSRPGSRGRRGGNSGAPRAACVRAGRGRR